MSVLELELSTHRRQRSLESHRGLSFAEIAHYNREYIARTGFPNSTGHIRKHIAQVCRSMRGLGVESLFSGCNINCSVGENIACAIPGSDVDSWTLVIREGVPGIKDLFSVKLDYALICKGEIPTYIFGLDELRVLAEMTYEQACRAYEAGDNQPISAAIVMEQIRYGTHLYVPGASRELFTTLQDKPLFVTNPCSETKNPEPKHLARKGLQKCFPSMPSGKQLVEQYVLIRTAQIYSERKPFELMDGYSQFTPTLRRLADRGLYEMEDWSGFSHYKPTWV